MRRNLREDVDVWENHGKIWARRYAGGSGKWENLSESEKLRYQSKLREQAMAAGMPEDMSAMSPPPKMSSIAPPGASKTVSRDVMDEARRLADIKIAKSHMAQIEAERQQRIEKQQRDMLEAVKKEIAQRRVDRAERQFQIAKDVYNRGGDAQELSDRFRLDLLGELRDSFWDETPEEKALMSLEQKVNGNADSGVWGYSSDELERMKQQEQAKKRNEHSNDMAAKMWQTPTPSVPSSPFSAEQINAAAAGLRQGYEPIGPSPFTAQQINEASEGLQSTAADQSGIWGMTPPQLAEAEKRYQQVLEAKRQAEQEHREQIRTKAVQERKTKAIKEAHDRYIRNESLPEDQIYFQYFDDIPVYSNDMQKIYGTPPIDERILEDDRRHPSQAEGFEGVATAGLLKGWGLLNPIINFFLPFSEEKIEENYEHNKKLALNEIIRKYKKIRGKMYIRRAVNEDGYIINQNILSDYKIGDTTMAENGCGVISTYNVLKMLGESPNFAELIKDFEKGTLGFLKKGSMGIDIGYIENYLKNKGYNVNSYYDETEFENEAKNADVSIIAYIRLNDLNHISGHFITFYPTGDTDPADGSMRYRFFNAGEYISNGNTISQENRDNFYYDGIATLDQLLGIRRELQVLITINK